MDRKTFCLLISVLCTGAFLDPLTPASAKELRTESACYGQAIALDCGKLSFVAVHEALFSSLPVNGTCHVPSPEDQYIDDDVDVKQVNGSDLCRQDVRVALNRKCSGIRNCNYSYSHDSERACFNPEGAVFVRYDCVRDTSLNKYCNSRVSSAEGYISSPGFPQYYSDLKQCSWSISASEGQQVALRVLHLHLRPPTVLQPTPADPDLAYVLGQLAEPVFRCDEDSLTIVEGQTPRFVLCGEEPEDLVRLRAEGSAGVELRFKSSSFVPASGFLLYYKVEGCPSLAPSEGSYLVSRNGSTALFACHGGLVFNATGQASKLLRCVRHHHWHDTLPPCVSPPIEELNTVGSIFLNATVRETEQNGDGSFLGEDLWKHIKFPDSAALIEDILVPVLLITVLIIGNCIIVCIIFAIRRKQKKNIEDTDENVDDADPQPLVTEADV